MQQAIFLIEDTTITSRYIADRRSLEELCAELESTLAQDPRLGLDTEFIRERTYSPVLEIIQISAVGGKLIAVIDVPAVNLFDLGPLGTLLLNPTITKVLHAGGQDIEILTQRLGRPPVNVYDTQIAAAFAGYSLQTGYGPLVQSVLNVKLSKDEGFADWSRRPLTAAMLAYAENDVRYLHPLHDRLSATLEQRRRTVWAREQMERMAAQAAAEIPAELLYERVGGRNILDARGLAILRELAIWRDEEAKRRDKPRRSVLKDDILVEISRRGVSSAVEILSLRSAPQNLGERVAEALAGCVRRGLAVSPERRPQPETSIGLDESGSALVELLSAVVKVRAMSDNFPASLLASGDELRMLAANRRSPDRWPSDLFTGWRGEILGKDLRAAIEGTLAVRWDSRQGRLVLLDLTGNETKF